MIVIPWIYLLFSGGMLLNIKVLLRKKTTVTIYFSLIQPFAMVSLSFIISVQFVICRQFDQVSKIPKTNLFGSQRCIFQLI